MKILKTIALPLALLTPDIACQRDLAAGFGAQSQAVDLRGVTGEFGNLGLQHLDGEIFVTTRVEPATGQPHFVSVFDAGGARTRTWLQPGFAQASERGFLDGATDGSSLCFGFDFGIGIVDSNGNPVETLQTQNGSKSVPGSLISGNVLAPRNAGICRALAYDRTGNVGDGSFWTGNFGSSTFEIDTDGDILRVFPNSGEFSTGFAIDPISVLDGRPTRMWVNGAPEVFANPLALYDLDSGRLTGRTMTEVLGTGGGLDIIPGNFSRGTGASGWDILHLQQTFDDIYRIRRLHLDVAGSGIPPSPVTRPGVLEPDLLSTVDDAEFVPSSDSGLKSYSIDSFSLNLGFDLSRNPGDRMGTGGLNGAAAVIFANIGPDAAIGVDASSNLLGIRELAHLQPLLTTPQASQLVRSRGMVLSNDPFFPSEWRIALIPGLPFQPIDDCVRFQGLWIDDDVAFLPIALTNQVRLCRGEASCGSCPLQDTYAECIGGNTLNADTSAGFFSVTNDVSDPNLSIVRLTWTVRPSDPSNSAQTQALVDNFFRWDTDSPGLADRFEGGDSLAIDCQGTYRNGSEVSTGLIFAGTSPQNGTPCDPTALQGWIGSDDGPTVFGAFDGDWLTLDFTFSPDTFLDGKVFEFDCDTDGGLGVSGAAMAGVIVVVEFRNGTISAGEMIADSTNQSRALVQL